MSKVREMAERLFQAERGGQGIALPWGHRPQLSDLWPVEQERYIRMAEEALGIGSEGPEHG